PLRRFIHKDDRTVFLDHMRRCRSDTGQFKSSLRLLGADSRIVPVELIPRRSLYNDESGYVFPTAVHDLTEREQAIAERNLLLETLMADAKRGQQRLDRAV